MSNERKLLIEPLSFEVANRMANSALPTDEERKAALEQTFAEMRKELHVPNTSPVTSRTREGQPEPMAGPTRFLLARLPASQLSTSFVTR